MPSKTPISLYVLAHPDDEYFCSQQLVNDSAAERRSIVVYLTDGNRNLSAIREKESLKALSSLGVVIGDVHFLGRSSDNPDGELHLIMRIAYDAMIRTLGSLAGDVLYVKCLAWEGGHHDHDAAHAIALAVANNLLPKAEIMQFPLYQGKKLPGSLFYVHHPLVENGPVSRVRSTRTIRAILMSLGYPSQWKTWMGLTPFFALKLLLRRGFTEQSVSISRLSQRPHSGALLYERRFGVPYETIALQVRKFLEETLS